METHIPNSSDRYLFTQEAADYLKVSVSTLYKYLEAGKLPGVKVMGRWRVAVSTLNQVLSGELRMDNPNSRYAPIERTPEVDQVTRKMIDRIKGRDRSCDGDSENESDDQALAA